MQASLAAGHKSASPGRNFGQRRGIDKSIEKGSPALSVVDRDCLIVRVMLTLRARLDAI